MLLVAAVLAFFALVARLLDLLRPRRLFEQLLAGCERAIDQVYPRAYEREAVAAEAPGITASVAHEGPEGVVLALDLPRLMALAVEADAVHRGGARGRQLLSWRGAPLAHVRGTVLEIPHADLERAIIVSDERTLAQDPAFAIRAIVDIAIRALSPAVNDPTTACQALDTLESILHRLAGRALGPGRLHDAG